MNNGTRFWKHPLCNQSGLKEEAQSPPMESYMKNKTNEPFQKDLTLAMAI